jgi:hypothetical protein
MPYTTPAIHSGHGTPAEQEQPEEDQRDEDEGGGDALAGHGG